jgi:hypothetical protein
VPRNVLDHADRGIQTLANATAGTANAKALQASIRSANEELLIRKIMTHSVIPEKSGRTGERRGSTRRLLDPVARPDGDRSGEYDRQNVPDKL